jgi:hypothetical protein
MAKLKLDLDDLGVESFETTDEEAGPRGTVRAHDSVIDSEGQETCGESGFYTCDYGTICLPQSTMAPSCGGQFSCKCTYGGPFCGG